MTDVRSAEQAGVPVVDFNMNRPTGLYGHWREIDDLQARYDFFWTTFAYGHWVLTDPETIREAFQRPDLFSSSAEVASEPNPKYTFIPTNIDPPEHAKYRHILNPWFSPGAVQRLAGSTTELCRNIIEAFRDRGSCEFIAEFASVYPTQVFMASLGLPLEDTKLFVKLVADIFQNLRDPAMSEALTSALSALRQYFSDALAERSITPRDRTVDFLTYLLMAEKDGRPLSEDEILNICQVLVMAGLETTAGQLSFMFHYLATHPDLRHRLTGEPTIVAAAVEEFLRAHAIVLPGRKLTQDIQFRGCPMKQGDMVMLPIAAANRCPAQLDHPADIDLDRPANRHIAFGLGPHRCLGLHLARRELSTAITVWHKLIPDYRLATDDPLVERGGQIGLERLSLAWD
jgi:cytochrome P450